MPFPTLNDDGQTVTLDLHGASVRDAEALALRTVQEAGRRGRARVRLIHGHSTSGGVQTARTIKHALHALLDGEQLSAYVVDVWRAEGHIVLGLALPATSDPRRMKLFDVMP
jgi:hypothetical protein